MDAMNSGAQWRAHEGEEHREVGHVCDDLSSDQLQLRIVLLKHAVRQHVLQDVIQDGVDLAFLKHSDCSGDCGTVR